MLRLFAFLPLAAFAMVNTASADTLTGCLTRDGDLTRIAVGSAPAKPCGKNQRQVTIGQGDAQSQIDQLTARVQALEAALNTPRTCKDILIANPAATDGVYTVDPDGFGGSDSIDVYCDMTTDGGGWTVIFQSSNPALWKTTAGAPGTAEWSQDLSGTSYPMTEALLIRVDTGESERVSGIGTSDLYTCKFGSNDRWWNGSANFGDGALHLGVTTNESKNPVGYVIVSHFSNPACLNDKRGWGFGHLGFINNQQGWGWDSNNLGPTVFAIGIR